MTETSCKSEAFDLRRDGDLIVFAKRTEHLVDGIVSGIIVDILSCSLFSVTLILGFWMIILSVTAEHPFHLEPRFNHFAAPEIVHATEAVFPALMGLMFVGMSVVLLRMIWFRQICFFPYQCRFKKAAGGLWAVQRKLWLLTYPWKQLDPDWRIWCYPSQSHGDWGYWLLIKAKRAKLVLAYSGVFTESKSEAQKEALKDLATLKDLFDVPGELKRWK